MDLPRLGGHRHPRHDAQAARRAPGAAHRPRCPAGLLLGMGLQNPGIDAVLERYAPTWAQLAGAGDPQPVRRVGGELAEAARRLEGVPGVAGIELNLSCANGVRGGVAVRAGRGRRRPSAVARRPARHATCR